MNVHYGNESYATDMPCDRNKLCGQNTHHYLNKQCDTIGLCNMKKSYGARISFSAKKRKTSRIHK